MYKLEDSGRRLFSAVQGRKLGIEQSKTDLISVLLMVHLYSTVFIRQKSSTQPNSFSLVCHFGSLPYDGVSDSLF